MFNVMNVDTVWRIVESSDFWEGRRTPPNINIKVMQTAQNIKLQEIVANPNNPRKGFNEKSIEELSQSILAQGVLQPIVVHKVDTNRYEIICGERRYKAALRADLEVIPAVVRENLSKEQILEIALIENLLREDVSPIEECQVYQTLMANNGYDIDMLMARFSKSESYIRSRMRLSDLIEEFQEMLNQDDISLAIALELCKYSEYTQREVYANHYEVDIHSNQNWIGHRLKSVVEMLEKYYSGVLDDYYFDKSECFGCYHNTSQSSLFAEDASCGSCLNRACLQKKNSDHIVQNALSTYESNPEVPLVYRENVANKESVESLKAKGCEVKKVDYYYSCPTLPLSPEREDYQSDEEYEEAMIDYGSEVEEYSEKSEALSERYKRGEIKIYVAIERRDVSLVYVETSSDDKSSFASEEDGAIEKLKSQDERNLEISIEKSIDEVGKLVARFDVSNGDFSALEEQITYFGMLMSLRCENYEKVGLGDDVKYLTDKNRFEIVQNLTDEKKCIIKRDFIISKLRTAYRGNYTAVMLNEYAKQHDNEQYEKITEKHRAVYEKRHKRIEEKIANLSQSK